MRRSEAIAALVAAGAVAVATMALAAFVVMILVGMWHGQRPAVPAIGFGESFLAVAIVGALVGPAISGTSK